MQPHRPLGNRHHGTGFELLSELLQELCYQNRGFWTAEAFAADANHRRFAGAADGQEPMEVGVEGHNCALLFERPCHDLFVRGPAVADVGDVAKSMP